MTEGVQPTGIYTLYTSVHIFFTFSVCGVHMLPENISAVGEFPTRQIGQRSTVYETLINFLLQRRLLEASFVKTLKISSDWLIERGYSYAKDRL